jgi:hypothetical protein
LPFIPEDRHGEPFIAFVTCWAGPLDEGAKAIQPIRDVAPIVAEMVGPMPYPMLNSAFDALVPPGLQHYWKANFNSPGGGGGGGGGRGLRTPHTGGCGSRGVASPVGGPILNPTNAIDAHLPTGPKAAVRLVPCNSIRLESMSALSRNVSGRPRPRSSRHRERDFCDSVLLRRVVL